MNMLTAEDLLPEFERMPQLVDGACYVIAEKPHSPHDALVVITINPYYVEAAKSWRFPDGRIRAREDRDLWIPLIEYPAAQDRARERNQQRTKGIFEA